jgi:hypothetical protein
MLGPNTAPTITLLTAQQPAYALNGSSQPAHFATTNGSKLLCQWVSAMLLSRGRLWAHGGVLRPCFTGVAWQLQAGWSGVMP